MKELTSCLIAGFLAFLVSAAFVNGQSSPLPTASKDAKTDQILFVQNEAGVELRLTAADLSKLKRISVKTSDHGTATVFEGVALIDVLKLAGVEFGEKLRGKRLASYLLVEAADKYQVVFALAELDPGFTDKVIILADQRDGRELAEKAGPWQIVAPDEKKAGRWVRQVVRLKILAAVK